MDTLAAPSDDTSAELRDRPFDGWRCPGSDRARSLITEITTALLEHETAGGLRQRKRRADDLRTFEATVSAIVCDLIHRHLTEPGKWLSVSLSNAVLGRSSRYKPRSRWRCGRPAVPGGRQRLVS